ncbi:MAG: hypothetical protein N2450_09415 [bacterium]|nr:hypothetical protein [bacterium]
MNHSEKKRIIIFCNGDVKTVQSPIYTKMIAIRGSILIGVALLLIRFSAFYNYQLGTVKQETVALENLLKKQELILNEKEAELNKNTSYKTIFEKAKPLGFIGMSKHFEKLAVSDDHFDPRWITEYKKRIIEKPNDNSNALAEKRTQKKNSIQ